MEVSVELYLQKLKLEGICLRAFMPRLQVIYEPDSYTAFRGGMTDT